MVRANHRGAKLRWLCLGTAVLVILATSCGGGSERSGHPEFERGRLLNARLVEVNNELWVVGGFVTKTGAPDWYVNNAAAVYSSGGSYVRTVKVPKRKGLAFQPAGEQVGGRRQVVIGSMCRPLVSDEASGCTGTGEVAVLDISDAPRWVEVRGGAAESSEATAHGGVNFAGADETTAWLVQSGGLSTTTFQLLALDLSSFVLREHPLPDGVRTSSSVCRSGDGLVAITTSLNDGGEVIGIVLHLDRLDGHGWHVAKEVPVPASLTGSGGVYCDASGLTVRLDASQPLLVSISPEGPPAVTTLPSRIVGMDSSVATVADEARAESSFWVRQRDGQWVEVGRLSGGWLALGRVLSGDRVANVWPLLQVPPKDAARVRPSPRFVN